ncbi:MAG: DUF1572 domain-containing protein [Bernardetiaceae bacterium]|jgi:uncharacterized damage-inducible protein DinB|nr:DUF1572 domain-containing protein [Bernardetiaceae bacterium]
MSTAELIHQTLLAEARRRLFTESGPRIHRCLGLLTEAEVWQRPNPSLNSAGNLVLHLCGNARQWILHGIGGRADHRQRQAEFDERGPVPTPLLLAQLDQLLAEIDQVLAQLTPEMLAQSRRVQGFDETVLSILVHVVEHFSYHVGQISYLTKLYKNVDLQYYGGHDLNTVG